MPDQLYQACRRSGFFTWRHGERIQAAILTRNPDRLGRILSTRTGSPQATRMPGVKKGEPVKARPDLARGGRSRRYNTDQSN